MKPSALGKSTDRRALCLHAMWEVLCILSALFLVGKTSADALDGFLWDSIDDEGESGEGFTRNHGESFVRQARSLLVYPLGGIFKLILGLGIPLPTALPNKTVAMGVNFQFQFPVPSNATPFLSAPRPARPSRAALYTAAEGAMRRSGLNGRACVLRAVCEAAETPLLHEGLLGEILHLLLTPSLGHARTELLEEYVAAEAAGAAGEVCADRFSACPPGHGLLDRISVLHHHDSS